MPQPAIGRIVRVLTDPKLNDGSDIASAVITRVRSDEPGGARYPAAANRQAAPGIRADPGSSSSSRMPVTAPHRRKHRNG